VVGARGEATLPTPFWRELNVARPRPNGGCWRVAFVGPEVDEPLARRRWQANSDVDAQFHAGLYHEAVKREHLDQPDFVVLFHPGLRANANSWAPSLRMLSQWPQVPCMITAFNAQDAQNDRAVNAMISPHAENPMASLEVKSFSGVGLVTVNKYVSLFNLDVFIKDQNLFL